MPAYGTRPPNLSQADSPEAKSLPTKPRFVGLWTWALAEFDNVKVYFGG